MPPCVDAWAGEQLQDRTGAVTVPLSWVRKWTRENVPASACSRLHRWRRRVEKGLSCLQLLGTAGGDSGQFLPLSVHAEKSKCTPGKRARSRGEWPVGAVPGVSHYRTGPASVAQTRAARACWGGLDPVPGTCARGLVTSSPRAVNTHLGMISHRPLPGISGLLIHKWDQMRTVCFERCLRWCQWGPWSCLLCSGFSVLVWKILGTHVSLLSWVAQHFLKLVFGSRLEDGEAGPCRMDWGRCIHHVCNLCWKLTAPHTTLPAEIRWQGSSGQLYNQTLRIQAISSSAWFYSSRERCMGGEAC